jgi:hypothetical protein
MTKKLLKIIGFMTILTIVLNLSVANIFASFTKKDGRADYIKKIEDRSNSSREYWKKNPLENNKFQQVLDTIKGENAKIARDSIDTSKIGTQVVKLSDDVSLEYELVVFDYDNSNDLFESASAITGYKQAIQTWSYKGTGSIEFFHCTLVGSYSYTGFVATALAADTAGGSGYPGWSLDSNSGSVSQLGTQKGVATGHWTWSYTLGVLPVGVTTRTVASIGYQYCDQDGTITASQLIN